ncbi:MAG: CHAT domain-containing protein [Pseudomonadota bacterium]
MKKNCAAFIAFSFMLGIASAQKLSSAPDAFLKDINSLSGVSRLGGALLAADPDKKKWGDYCSMSQALAQRGEFRESIRTASKALYMGESANANYGAAIIYASNDIATAYSYAGDHATANEWADRTLQAISRGYESWAREPVRLIEVNAYRLRALHLGQAGKHANALAEIDKAIKLLPSFGGGFIKSELNITVSGLQLRAGQTDAALETARKVAATESDPLLKVAASRAVGDAALAGKAFALAAEAYGTALAAAVGRNDPYQVAMAQLGLARALRASSREPEAIAELGKAIAGLENLRGSFRSLEIRTALFGNLQAVFDEAVDFYVAQGKPELALAASEASRARGMLDLQRKVLNTASNTRDVGTRPASLAQIQSALAPRQLMVSYHQLPDKLIVWMIGKNSLQVKALPASADQMRLEVARFRQQIEAEDKAAMVTAKNLYATLIAPLTLAPQQDIIFVPHKSLHLLPFQALHDGSQWLVQSHAISTVLSASLLSPGVAQGTEKSLAALGNPDLGRAEWSLPGAEREVRAIQAFYPNARIYLNKDASKARLIEIAPKANVVHVAAHGVVDEIDPMFSVLKLATLGAVGSDMEARELATLDLSKARLVSLSACNSGVGKVAQGDEFMGFKRALFSAGAASALISLWPVDDDSTQILMTDFHGRWKDQSLTRAMQAAQIKVLSDPRFANPFYWAAFTLVGDPN